MAKTDHFLITCEHGGNLIPSRYRHLFTGFEALLQTHRGYDAGALALARELARALAAPLFVSTTSRLLIDLNRSIGHPRLYSEATRDAPVGVRSEILKNYYLSYRNKVEADIAEAIAHGSRVIHVASHSFTPVLDGAVRNADIGLLYDPARSGEAELCRRWQAQLKSWAPELKVRRNYPYAGKSDGFTAYLRRRFPVEAYIGIELEVNQKHVFNGGRHWRAFRAGVIEALREAARPLFSATLPDLSRQ
ncbi:N-formylglutamate amidohydrolase [Sulfuricella sp.]|uniref:N-formylglutamate amidohydrolase n=1 Tax=Sulfuricella sp. TaxID=2099377 RepID=UPI002C9BBDDF|nr:N-formylglutamate amidohydrolase [Sulfuricella sp.]HUX63212.1 N-formylglutamate amidohydrolase [Sulfuricella sp.]